MVKRNKNKKLIIQGRDMIEELGLEELSEEKKVEIIERMGGILHERILLRLIKELTDKEAEKVNDLLKRERVEDAYRYIERKVPNFNKIIQKEVEKFQKEMIKRVKERIA